jgi:hypothetical protein
MSNQRQTSPLPENSAEEEDQQEDEDKKLQEPSQEPTGGGGDERKVVTLPLFPQKTSIAREGPILKPCAANAMGSDPIKDMIYSTLASFKAGNIPRMPLELKLTDFKAKSLQASKNLDSPRLSLRTPDKHPFQNSAKDGEDGEGEGEEEDKNLQQPSQEPTGGGDERKVPFLPPSAQKTSIARKGPILKPCAGNATGSDPILKEMINRVIHDALASLGVPVPVSDAEEEDSDFIKIRRALYFSNYRKVAKRPTSNIKLLNSHLSLPFGTQAKRPLENSAKDGASQPQGKEKMMDKVHGEEGGGEENPRMSNRSQTSPLPENSAEEEVKQEEEEEEEKEGKEEEDEEEYYYYEEEKEEDKLPYPTIEQILGRDATCSDPWAPWEQEASAVLSRLIRSSDDEERYYPHLQDDWPVKKHLYPPRLQPLGKCPFESSAKDGVSQGKVKKIEDKVHGEDGEGGDEGEDGGKENPKDDSGSI